MARKTKEDAQITRHKLLDAALEVFHEKGVAGATLSDVAQAASLTRGAIYWHFKDKADLFNAMMERATLPFEQAWAACQAQPSGQMPTLERLLQVLRLVLRSVSEDDATRKVFDIALLKMEHVGEMREVRERRIISAERFVAQMEIELTEAARQRGIALPVHASIAARGLHAVFDGVLHAWLLNEARSFSLESDGMAVLELYLQGLGLSVNK